MWIKSSGQISEVTYHIATPISSHLLIAGEYIALIDTGVSICKNVLLGELKTLLGDDFGLDCLLLTHSSFDSIGAIPYLKEEFSDLKIYSSKETSDFLKDEDFKKSAYDKNKELEEAFSFESINMEFDSWSEAIKVDEIVGDGDIVDLGAGVEVKVISAPGYSSDLNAYYIPIDSAIAAAEGLGSYGGRDKIYPSFCHSYSYYMKTLEKISALEIRLVSLPHSGVLTGDLAQKFVLDLTPKSEELRFYITSCLEKGELVEEVVKSMLLDWKSSLIYPTGPFEKEQENTIRQIVEAVSK